jgi:membrane-associated phospholipid phosphatase
LYPIILWIFLLGLVVSARLALEAHTFDELIAGVLVGLGFPITVLFL